MSDDFFAYHKKYGFTDTEIEAEMYLYQERREREHKKGPFCTVPLPELSAKDLYIKVLTNLIDKKEKDKQK